MVQRDRAAALKLGLEALRSAPSRTLVAAAAGLAAMALPISVFWAVYPGERMNDAFPPDYSYAFGVDRPFAPSLAATTTRRAFDSRRLAGSESCGTRGCHEQITAEWRVSAHRWSAMDAAFQRIQSEMAKQNGAESTRYCGGCHDPISLFSGTKNTFTDKLTSLAGNQEGVSCLACHSIRKTDVKGNANFVVGEPHRYLFELREGEGARLARDFLIRAYPWQHAADLSKRVFFMVVGLVLFVGASAALLLARPRQAAYVPGVEAETSGEITHSLDRERPATAQARTGADGGTATARADAGPSGTPAGPAHTSAKGTTEAQPVTFSEIAEAVGLHFKHFDGRRSTQLPEDMGSGLARGATATAGRISSS